MRQINLDSRFNACQAIQAGYSLCEKMHVPYLQKQLGFKKQTAAEKYLAAIGFMVNSTDSTINLKYSQGKLKILRIQSADMLRGVTHGGLTKSVRSMDVGSLHNFLLPGARSKGSSANSGGRRRPRF